MKTVGKRLLQLLIFIWVSTFMFVYGLSLIRLMKLSINSDVIIDIEIRPFLVLLAIYCILSILWIVQSKKKFNGNNFFRSDVVILDEDERGLLIHYKASQEAMHITQALAIGLTTYTLAIHQLDIKIENLIVALAILYTVHVIVYYYKLKKMYYA